MHDSRMRRAFACLRPQAQEAVRAAEWRPADSSGAGRAGLSPYPPDALEVVPPASRSLPPGFGAAFATEFLLPIAGGDSDFSRFYRALRAFLFDAPEEVVKQWDDLMKAFDDLSKSAPAVAEAAFARPKSREELRYKGPPRSFNSWQEMRNHLGRPPAGYAWHHIIPQTHRRGVLSTAGGIRRYINHTDNVVLVPAVQHTVISAIMNTMIAVPVAGRFRDNLSRMPIEFQREAGRELLRITGVWNGK